MAPRQAFLLSLGGMIGLTFAAVIPFGLIDKGAVVAAFLLAAFVVASLTLSRFTWSLRVSTSFLLNKGSAITSEPAKLVSMPTAPTTRAIRLS